MIKHSVSIRSPSQQNLSSNQLNLLREYSTQLEAENKAKSQEIAQLTRQLNQALLQIRNSQKDNSAINYKCQTCTIKDQSIAKHSSQIISLKQRIQKYEQIIKEKETTISEKQRTIKVIEKSLSQFKAQQTRSKVGANQRNQILKREAQIVNQLQSLKKKYNQLLLSQENRPNNIGSTNNFCKQNQVLKNQNMHLMEKITYLEKRIFIVEDSNKILKEQILSQINLPKVNMSKVNKPLSAYSAKYSCPICQSAPKPEIKAQEKNIQCHLTNEENYNSGIFKKREKRCRQKTFCEKQRCCCLYQKKMKDSLISHSQYLSPLRVLNNSSQSYHHFDQRNLIQEHTKNLQRKISFLMGQNSKLRSQAHNSFAQ